MITLTTTNQATPLPEEPQRSGGSSGSGRRPETGSAPSRRGTERERRQATWPRIRFRVAPAVTAYLFAAVPLFLFFMFLGYQAEYLGGGLFLFVAAHAGPFWLGNVTVTAAVLWLAAAFVPLVGSLIWPRSLWPYALSPVMFIWLFLGSWFFLARGLGV